MRLLSCYHSTQAGPLAIDRSGKDPESVGRSFDGVELRVAGPKGDRLSANEAGPIWVALAGAVDGVGAEDASAQAQRRRPDRRRRQDGLAAHRRPRPASTKPGRLVITGREDDVVKVDGKRVALGEVEGCLEAFPKIKAAQARVVTDPMAGRWSSRAS